MKRFILLCLFACSFAFHAWSQAPQGINYQGVARDTDGKPVVSHTLSIRISILKNSSNGDVEYSEVHQVTTNQFGLFTLIIGKGSTLTGLFNYVSWALGEKWLQIEMDINGGNSYTLMGSQQLMSVPFAFYSQYSGNGLQAGQGISIANGQIINTGDADANPTNEIQDLNLASNVLKITNNSSATPINLAPFLDNTDSQTLSLTGTTLSIQGGNAVNLSGLATDAQNLSMGTPSGTSRTINISNGTGVTFDVGDNDNNSSNEIQDLTLTSNILKITNNAGATGINLAPYLDNTDAQTLSLSGNNLTISGGNAINLSGINTDAQTLSLAGTNLAISGGNNINLAGINTDAQSLSLAVSGTNRTINISGGTGVTIDVADNDNNPVNEAQTLTKTSNVISLSAVSGSGGGSITLNDDDPVNEIQDLTLNANILKITNNATATSINLAPYLDNTDTQNLSLGTIAGTQRTINITNGTSVTLDVADNDNSPTNEIQDLNLSSNILKITNNATATNINLAPYLQTLTYTAGTNNLAVSGGNNVTISHTLNQVLTQNNSAGNLQIKNVLDPTANQDAATKNYVDTGDALLAARLATTYAFKTGFDYTNSGGVVVNNQDMLFTTEDFDDFNVLATNTFTAAENGTYVFMVDGSYLAGFSGGQLSLFYNSVKYPIAIVQPWGGSTARFNATFMFKLTSGQTVKLVADNISVGAQFSGTFFGYKL